MALWFPLYVNQKRIAHVEIVRIETTLNDSVHTYQWSVTDLQDSTRSAAGTVNHPYEEGAMALVWRALLEYFKTEGGNDGIAP